jgi:hypothetical protein
VRALPRSAVCCQLSENGALLVPGGNARLDPVTKQRLMAADWAHLQEARGQAVASSCQAGSCAQARRACDQACCGPSRPKAPHSVRDPAARDSFPFQRSASGTSNPPRSMVLPTSTHIDADVQDSADTLTVVVVGIATG